MASGKTETGSVRKKPISAQEVQQAAARLEELSGEVSAYADKVKNFDGMLMIDGRDMIYDAMELVIKWLSRAEESHKTQTLPRPAEEAHSPEANGTSASKRKAGK